jgi:hypothetical protein
MTFTTPFVSVEGIPSAVPTVVENTSGPVASAFFNAIQPFMAILELPSTQALSAGNLESVNSALQTLNNLVQFGALISSTGNVTLLSSPPTSSQLSTQSQSLVTLSMAQDYSAVLLSLASVGVNISASNLASGDAMSSSQLQEWRGLSESVSAIGNTVQAASLDGFSGSQTLQSMLLVDFVQTGNNVIAGNLSALNTALETTENVIGTLTSLQNLHNQVTTTSGTFNFNLNEIPGTNAAGLSAFQAQFITAASAFFDKPVVPVLISGIGGVGSANTASALISFVNTFVSLTQELAQLSAQASPSDLTNPNSVFSTTKLIISDMTTQDPILEQLVPNPATGAPATLTVSGLITIISANTGANFNASNPNSQVKQLFSGFQSWMLDNFSAFNDTNASLSGKISQDITAGITAAENLNDTQKANVQNFLFVFQEYYQSASAAIQAISSILTQMAQNIAR